MFYDLYQTSRVDSANAAASQARESANDAAHLVLQLHRRLERLALGCQALWELLRERGGITEDDLRNKVLEIDLRDGLTDGKIQQAITECPKCHARTNSKRETCVMCGAPLQKKHAFEV